MTIDNVISNIDKVGKQFPNAIKRQSLLQELRQELMKYPRSFEFLKHPSNSITVKIQPTYSHRLVKTTLHLIGCTTSRVILYHSLCIWELTW